MDVRTLCLGVLSTGAHSGYEINKTVEQSFRHIFRASVGSIYPALAELERFGLVTVEAVAQDGKPDKKVYSITPTGRQELRERLAAENPRHTVRSEFLVLMYFAHLLDPTKLEQVIDHMTAEFERIRWQDIEDYERTHEHLTPGQRFALGYGRAVLGTALAYLQQEKGQLLQEVAESDASGRPAHALSLIENGA